MKKLFLITILMATTSVFAQIEKGAMYVGADAGISSTKTTMETVTPSATLKGSPSLQRTWNLTPQVTYFIMQNIALGLAIGASGTSSEQTTILPGVPPAPSTSFTNTSKQMGPTLGLWGRKYWNCSPNIYFYSGAGLNLAILNGENTSTQIINNVPSSNTSKIKTNNSSIGLHVGFAYHITTSVLLTTTFSTLKFFSNRNKSNIIGDTYSLSKSSGFDLDIANGNLSFGFLYKLNSKKTKKQAETPKKK